MAEALRLAAELDQYLYSVPAHPLCTDASAELRRLHAENERLAAEVANRNRRALDGDEAVSALANVHAYYEKLEAQRDALLEQRDELRRALEIIAVGDATNPQAQAAEELIALGYWRDIPEARAAIKAVEETK